MSNKRNRQKAQSKQVNRRPSEPQARNTGLIYAEQMLEVSERWTGPLPRPDDLRGYDEVVPGSAQDIVTAFKEQGEHRRKQENRVVLHREIRSYIGQTMGFIIAIAFLLVSAWLINGGHELAGAALGTLDLGALVAVFVYGRREG